MRVLAVLVGLYGLVHAVPLSAQPVQDCTPPAVKDGIDRGMPCYQHPPALGVETQVRFARGSAVVTGEAQAILDRQAEVLSRNASLQVTLYGHTDPDEDEAIALKRAEAVSDYLLSRGVALATLAVSSRGHRAMIATTPTEAAFAAMRVVTTEPRMGR